MAREKAYKTVRNIVIFIIKNTIFENTIKALNKKPYENKLYN